MITGQAKSIACVSIQCDWENQLRTPDGLVWMSYKFKDSPSVQGKIASMRTEDGKVGHKSLSPEFSVTAATQNYIEVALPKIQQSAILLAPVRTYTTIHTHSVTSIHVASTGLAISGSSNSELVVWDTINDEKKLDLKGHKGDIYKARFFPSEKVVLSCGGDMRLKIWCAETGVCPVTLAGHAQAVTDFAIVERGRNILSVSKDGSAKLWHCGEGNCIADIIKVSSSINCCHLYATTTDHGKASTVNEEKEIGTEDKVLAIGCEDGMVYSVHVRSRKLLFSHMCASPVNALWVLCEEKLVAGCQNGDVVLLEIKEGKVHLATVFSDSASAVFSLYGHSTCGVYIGRADGSVMLRSIDGPSMKVLLFTGPDADPVYDISSDGQFIFTASRDHYIRRYSTKIAVSKMFGGDV